MTSMTAAVDTACRRLRGSAARWGRRSLAAAALLAASAGLGAQWDTARAQDALAEIKQRGQIVVGTEFQFAPFEFLQGDKPVGFDVDLFDLIAKDLGVEVKWVDLPWVSVLPGLEARKYDMVVAGTTASKARLDRYFMTLPIGDATVALVKRTDNAAITKPADIAGKTVGGTKGSMQLQTLVDFGKTLPGGLEDVKVYIGSTNLYADVTAGRIAAASGSLPNLLYLTKNQADLTVVQPAFGPPAYLCWVLRKTDDSKPLLDAVNAEIKKLNEDGTIGKLQVKWFGAAMKLPVADIPPPTN
jgi:polar amino acid transport system substrate-binding protein